MKALIFDLDDTLISETPAIEASFVTVTQEAGQRFGIDPAALLRSLQSRALEMWNASAGNAYCQRLGINSWEGLTSDFPGPADDTDLAFMRSWAPEYRHQSWLRALADFGVESPDAAAEFAARFWDLRHRDHHPYPDTEAVLSSLRDAGYLLGIITNGPSDLQRSKLAASGLTGYFRPEATLVSSETGYGKPEPQIFQCALERLSVEPREAVMVGDNAQRDIGGALGVGMHAVWMRHGRDDSLAPAAATRIESLSELPAVLERLRA